jgi:hypothetical protein
MEYACCSAWSWRSIIESKPSEDNASTVKKQAHELIDELPDNATWDELAYRIAVRASIERGLADAEAGRLIPVEEVMREFGITE